MIKEEENILRRFGKEEPFTVPEGYFDDLTERIMDVLPKKEIPFAVERRKKRRMNMRLIGWCSVAAACIACVALFYTKDMVPEKTTNVPELYTEEAYEYDDEFQEDVMHYAMLGHEDVYCYLSGVGF